MSGLPRADAGPAPAAGKARPGRMMWPELDLLRGLAGLAMVVNHTAVELVPASAASLISVPDQPLSMTPVQWVSFLGSFAPMLFFFITGVGYGLQARPGGAGRKAGLWSKVAVLFLADALLLRVGGLWIGLDFFGFIALSMLLLGLLIRLDRRAALTIAAALLVLVSVLRYSGQQVAARLLGLDAAAWVALFTGQHDVHGLSFPPMPWLGYPLVGFWVGAAATSFADQIDRRRLLVGGGLLLAGGLFVAAAAVFIDLGFLLFRWGRLSPSSYAAGFGLLALLLCVCLVVFRTRGARAADRGPHRPLGPAVRGLSLRGVAAFAVVPLHFLILSIAEGLGVTVHSSGTLFLAMAVVSVLALGLAPLVSSSAERIRAGRHVGLAWWSGLAVALLALGVLCVPGWEGPARSTVASVGQLALCLLLALPMPGLSRSPGTHATPVNVR